MSELYLRYVLVVAEYMYMYVGLKGYIFKFINKKVIILRRKKILYVSGNLFFFLYLMIPSEMCRFEWLGDPVYWISIWNEATLS
jgi:hypothetical protein